MGVKSLPIISCNTLVILGESVRGMTNNTWTRCLVFQASLFTTLLGLFGGVGDAIIVFRAIKDKSFQQFIRTWLRLAALTCYYRCWIRTPIFQTCLVQWTVWKPSIHPNPYFGCNCYSGQRRTALSQWHLGKVDIHFLV